MDKISILVIYVEKVLEHTEDKTWDGENLAKRTESQLAGDSNKEGHCQKGEKYPPFLTPGGDDNGHKDGNAG